MSDVPSSHNPIDALVTFVGDRWPELETIPGVWLTGGQVWRRVLGFPTEDAKDTDMCCVTHAAHNKVTELLDTLLAEEDWGPQDPPSLGPLGGLAYWTKRGRVDIWKDDSIVATLRRYSDAKAAVRMAYSPSKRRLMWLPSHVVRKPGERYIYFEEATDLQGTKLEWREWHG